PRGFVLEQVDDHHGNDPRIVFKASQAGSYYVRMFAFPADPNSSIQFSSSDRYIYRLTLTTGPYVDHVEPLALSAVAPSPPVARGWNLPDEGLSLTTSKGPSRSDVSLAAPTNFLLQRLPRINAPAL